MTIKAYKSTTITLSKEAVFTIFKEYIEAKLGDTVANIEWQWGDNDITSCRINMSAQTIHLK